MDQQTTVEITSEKLILRDHLAADRTELANERTLLAYIRTAFTFILAGATIFKFFNSISMYITASVCIGIGIIIVAIGLYRFHKVQKHIRKAKGEEAKVVRNFFPNFSFVKTHIFSQSKSTQ